MLYRDIFQANKQFQIKKSYNPYREDTLEFWLLQFTISYYEFLGQKKEGKKKFHYSFEKESFPFEQHMYSKMNTFSIEIILDYFKNHQFFYLFNASSSYNLVDRAIHLGLMNDCISYAAQPKEITRPQVGTFWEFGLVDFDNQMIHKQINQMIHKYKMLQNQDGVQNYESLSIGLKKTTEFKNKYRIPTMVNYQDEESDGVKIKNISFSQMNQINSLPIYSWNQPNYGISLEDRGIIHHCLDAMAFIENSIDLADTYLFGYDQLGNITVFHSFQENGAFKQGDVLNEKDIDFIFSVPAGSPMIFQSKAFENESLEEKFHCKLNDQDNALFPSNFWNNEIFKKYSKREMNEMSYLEFKDFIVEKYIECFEKDSTWSMMFNLSNDFNIMLLNYLSYLQENKELLKNNYIHEAIEKLSKKFNCSSDINSVFNIFYDFLIKNHSGFLQQKLDISLLDHNDDDDFLLEDYEHKYQYNIFFMGKKEHYIFESSPLISYRSIPKDIENKEIKLCVLLTKTILQTIDLEHDNLSPFEFQRFNPEDIDNKFSHITYFYKTISHKVGCEIFNPQNINEQGFFKKENSSKLNIQKLYLDYFKIRNYYLLDNEKRKECLRQYLHKEFDERMPKEYYFSHLIDYWKDFQKKSLVISEIKDMNFEYRIFIKDNEPIVSTPCFRNTHPYNNTEEQFNSNLVDGHSSQVKIKHILTEYMVKKYIDFAKKFASEINNSYPQYQNYVIDLSFDLSSKKLEKFAHDLNYLTFKDIILQFNHNQEKLMPLIETLKNLIDEAPIIPIEINSFNWSGCYEISMKHFCTAITTPKYDSQIDIMPKIKLRM